jgi:formate C-acetyltransferase
MAIDRVAGKTNRKKHSGQAKWHNCTIGGLTADGRDASNRLSYLILEAARVCPTPHHTITIRVHKGTPDELLEKGLEVVRQGLGLPAFVGDPSYIAFLTRHGVPLEQARDYLLAGCLDAALLGRSRVVSFPFVVVPLIFEITLNNGRHPRTGAMVGLATGEVDDLGDFDSLVAAVKAQLRHFIALTAERNHAEVAAQRDLYADPILSSLLEGGALCGRDYLDRRMPFENGSVMCPVGMVNVADSLAAIRKLVFEEERISLCELKAVLEADWEDQEELRAEFLSAPKFGNDDDYVDAIAADLYRFWAETVSSFSSPFGAPHVPTAISITSHWAGGELTGATPDGRRAGQCLADGSMSPMHGRDQHGPTAVIRSALKTDQDAYQATLLNLKLHRSALATKEDLRKLASLIRTYLELGGKHLQFNVIDRATLLDAQEHPDEHRDLIVRVAGYSAYFVTLSRRVQDDIIARTEHASVA